tara:strand:- start:11999 stop:12520 length:522 start_codon:yes stop_codon:yes gene_type:complete
MTPPVLTTRRLTLRPISLDDAHEITRGLGNWDVVQWLIAPPFPYSRDDAIHFINETIPGTTTWAVDAGDGLIGVIGVKPNLGYWLNVEYHGQHIMTEAAQAVINWYFANCDAPLASGYLVGNGASRTILENLGFVNTNKQPQMHAATQDIVSRQGMELTRENWQANIAEPNIA